MIDSIRKKVLLIGYGEMGHAMEYLLADQHNLTIWQRHPQQGEAVDLVAAASDSDFVIYCVPASPIALLANQVREQLPGHSISISFAKGLDDQGRLPAQVLEEIYGGKNKFCMLYGPMISEEIRANHPAFAQVGTPDNDLFEQVASLFRGTNLYLDHSDDLIGLSWSAMLKNVYAILFGVADELQLGDNMRGYLTVTAIREMGEIVDTLGGSGGTCRQLAGLGDLVTTATSIGSHHHELGRLLVRGRLEEIRGEGIHTLKMVERYSLLDASRYPLYNLVNLIVKSPGDVREKIEQYLEILIVNRSGFYD